MGINTVFYTGTVHGTGSRESVWWKIDVNRALMMKLFRCKISTRS